MATKTQSPGVGFLAALEGAGLVVWSLVATPFVGRKRLRWGTQETEATDPLPGDELVPDPKWSYTLGIDVAAAPEAVWPWIAQIGQRRRWRTWSGARSATPPRSSPSISIPRSGMRSTCIRRRRLCGSESWTRRTRWFSSAPRPISLLRKAGGSLRGSSPSGPDQLGGVDSSPVAAVISPPDGQPGSLSGVSPSNPSHS